MKLKGFPWQGEGGEDGSILPTCCMILENSAKSVFWPASSKTLSRVRSWRATSVVSSKSRPAWFANMQTGNGACTEFKCHRRIEMSNSRNEKRLGRRKEELPTFDLKEQHMIASGWCHMSFSRESPAGGSAAFSSSTPVWNLHRRFRYEGADHHEMVNGPDWEKTNTKKRKTPPHLETLKFGSSQAHEEDDECSHL